MKLSILFAAAFALAISASTSQAAIVDLTGTNYDLGTVGAGQNGTITTTPIGEKKDAQYGYVTGVLAPNTTLVFTYRPNVPGMTPAGSLASGSLYVGSWFQDTALGFNIFALDESAGPPVGSIASTLPVTVIARLIGAETGTTTIRNASSQYINFVSYAMGASIKGSYATYGASAVPLPAAALMFGSGLIGLVGVARRKARA